MRLSNALASDADRDRSAASLHEHVAVGRITLDEFRERLDQVYEARTFRELDRATAGLPPPSHPGSPPDRRERRYRRGWARYLRVNVVVWSLWLAADLVSSHSVALFPLLLTLPWGVARLAYAPRWRGVGRARP